MTNGSVVIIGLPESGKTTFLAALWHLVTARDQDTVLHFDGLKEGDASHLNAIAARWRDAKVQDRTAIEGGRVVSMNLRSASGEKVCLTFPDMPGEEYRRMWEERECDKVVAENLAAGNVLLFVHSDSIRFPLWVKDEREAAARLDLEGHSDEIQPWRPEVAPTQVQLVDLLQALRNDPLDAGPRRLAVMLSAWDLAAGEQLSPEAYLAAKLPLLSQYLRFARHQWEWRVYGLSAQGGVYDLAQSGEPSEAAESLRGLDLASSRIRLLGPTPDTSDITEPIAWLVS